MEPEQGLDSGEWLTVKETSDTLKVHEETVRRWIREGELPVLDLGGQKTGYRILRTELDRFLRERYGLVGKDAA